MSASDGTPRCPACGADPVSSLACLACGAILPGTEQTDHFRRLALDPLQPFDPALAEARYLQLSRLLHPDFQTRADEATRGRALRQSALLNEAWRVLNDEQLRAEYLLELHHPGALEANKQLDPAFLMEAMELSEELEQAQATGCQETIQRIASLARKEIDERMHGVASACSETIRRIADSGPAAVEESSHTAVPSRPITAWNTEEIATLLHQARVYRRILRDTEALR